MKTSKDGELTSISIQGYGGLVVINLQFLVVGISSLSLEITSQSITTKIGCSMDIFFQQVFGTLHLKLSKLVKKIATNDLPKHILTLRFNRKSYYFKCYKANNLLYLEWEPQIKTLLSASNLNQIGSLLDRTYPNKWNMLCRSVNSFLDFDRVVVLQVHETGQSRIIAHEGKKDNKLKLNQVFSESFMSSEAIAYFQSAEYRYVPSIKSNNQTFYTIDKGFDELCSSLAILPKVQAEYFAYLKIASTIFFPLIVNGKFWGLVIGYHNSEKIIDLQQRKLCAFFVQNATSKYESSIRQIAIEKNEQLRNVENFIKERLYRDKSVNCTMINIMDTLNDMNYSDGVAIYNEGELFFHGHTPNGILFREIIAYLGNYSKKIIFKDNNFKLNRSSHFSQQLNFAGLLSYRLDHNSDYYIVWFRKEKQTKITHIETASKVSSDSPTKDSDHKINVWESLIRDTSIAWSEEELNFIAMLKRVINESILHKVKVKERLAEELETMNNELEMFTFTLAHDLKNPLSILGTGLHFLIHNAHNIPKENLISWHKSLHANIDNITDIIDNIVFLSQNKIKSFTKDPIPMHYTIKKIVQESIQLHESIKHKVVYGKLYPIWGEKSAFYQVFTNIIGNAIKYSKSKELPRIAIRSYLHTDYVHYNITDNGIGIPKHNQGSIFDMFVRADNALGHKGSGIGLTLVKRIMDRLGGTIKISSIKSKGTQVDLYFPLVEQFPTTMLSNI